MPALGNCGKMGVDAVLVGAVVIRRDVERGVGAGIARAPSQLDRVGGVVRPAAGDHRDLARGDLDRNLDQPAMLGVGQGRPLARGAARDQPVAPFGDLPGDEISE